jgi:4-amino-4-deoxy-L-arabinose transferase-like glycosyltransferase
MYRVRGRVSSWAHVSARPSVAAGAGVVLAVAVFVLWRTANPVGFARDETSISLNAFSIAGHGRNQRGSRLPLFFQEYDVRDYLSPIYIYLLALVFKVTGPSIAAARELGASSVFAALLALGLLARRRTGSAAVAVAVIVLGALTPWLYELSRTTFEMTLEPLMLVLVLLAVDWAYRSQRPALVRGLAVGLALAGLTYEYTGGRGLAPLYACALILFAGRGRWRWLIAAWATYLVLLIPLALHHKQASGRYHDTTFITSGMSVFAIAKHLFLNYATDVNLVHWIRSGDPKPYIHTSGAGQLLAGVVLLALAGAVIVLVRLRGDLWWRWLLVVLVVSPIPAALTVDRHDAERLLPLPVLLLVVAVPALERLLRWNRRRWAVGLAIGLALVLTVQFGRFEQVYQQRGASRRFFFEADVPSLLARAFANGRTVYIDHDDIYAQTDALWYAVTHGLPEKRVSILPDGGMPPTGSSVFGRDQACDYVCERYATADTYWIARAVGPLPSPPTLSFGTGFNGPEQFQGSTHRWMIQDGKLVIDIHGGVSVSATITGQAFSNQQPRTLALESRTGRVLARATVSTDLAPLTLGPFRLRSGASTLTLVSTPGPVRLGADDPRSASVYLSPLTVSTTY